MNFIVEGRASMSKRHQIIFQSFLVNAKGEFDRKYNQKVLPISSCDDYKFMRTLGRGSYGEVLSAVNIYTENLVAIKVIPKKNLIKTQHLRHLISEIKILNACNFEFLVSMHCYFTNKCFVFIVMPYVDGGHFFHLLRKLKKFHEEAARFFAGQVVLAIEYLHYMGIVYRDLKPENLLLDLHGYLKLVDYGFAKNVGTNYCYTFCGTPEYIAPEILLGNGYKKSPDWWTLGILLFEMCNGEPPFRSKNELTLYEKILKGRFVWPQGFSVDLKSLIRGLLQVDKTKRLGCMKNKTDDIKFHKWFDPLDWTALWYKKILPPIRLHKTSSEKETRFNFFEKRSFKKCPTYVTSSMILDIDFGV